MVNRGQEYFFWKFYHKADVFVIAAIVLQHLALSRFGKRERF